jgi:periplasmic divalent cation tolerance protein
MSAICVVTTVGTEEQANLIARELVRGRHAACVNILRGVRSVYRWQGKICQDSELLLLIKTTEEEFEAISGVIGELHSYEVPEILAFQVTRGAQDFLQWITGSVDKEALFADDEEEDELVFEEVD